MPKDPTENPWQTLEGRFIYENPWISLTEFQVINPSGNPGIYGKVHFKNQGVGVVPYEDGYIWLVGQYRYTLNEYQWEIPEGGGPWGEDPLEAAKRELQEETGLIAERYTPIIEMNPSNSVSDEWFIVYLAQGLTQGPASPEETEQLQVKKVTLEEAYAEVEAHRMRDSMTVAAVYKLMLLKVQGKL